MYTDSLEIKRNYETNVINTFGEQAKEDIALLINNVSGKDTYIDENLWLKLQNLLPLKKQEALYLIQLALELSSTSSVAVLVLLEKIPTLIFYDVLKDIGQFLLNIKNYGLRAVALFLGREQTNSLRMEDLVDVLEQSTLCFYKTLLHEVNARHQEFGVCCALIMRFSAKIETAIFPADIIGYLNVCAQLIKTFGAKITEQYIRHAHEFISFIPLKQHVLTLEGFAKKSLTFVEFAVTYPKIVFSQEDVSNIEVFCFDNTNVEDMKGFKIRLLQTENYLAFLEHPKLSEDKDFLALMMNWPTFNIYVKSNILFQLKSPNYKQYILTNDAIEAEREQVHSITGSGWLKSWFFSGEVVDLSSIRKRLGTLLQNPLHFSLESKSIVKKHSDVFNRANKIYDAARIYNMVGILSEYCVDKSTMHELLALGDFIMGNQTPLRDFLSQESLVIQTWERDPWTDYGRSDELFSCTSIGDYNAGNAPAFIADINLNNLDIWSHGARVGRVRLCLVKDASDVPMLLLDCVDGTERVLASSKRFEFIMTAAIAYAKNLGIKYIKLNYDVDFNTTPKKFIRYAEEFYQQQNRVDFIARYLPVNTSKHLMPYPCQTFLESFVKNNGAFVRGAVISTSAESL